MTDTETRVRQLLVEDLGADINIADILDTWTLTGELNLNSLEATEFVLRLEEEFDVEIPDHIVTANMTVAEVCAAVERLKA